MTALNVYIITTLFCWSLWGIFDKKALESAPYTSVLLILYLMSVWEAPLVAGYLFWSQPGTTLHAGVWIWTFFASCVQAIALGAYLLAMSISEASIVLSLTAAYPLVTQFLAIPFLGESFVVNRAFGALAIGAGVGAIGWSAKSGSAKPLDTSNKVRLTLSIIVATVGWGVWGLLDKKAVSAGTPAEAWLSECIWECVLLAIVYLFARFKGYAFVLNQKKAWLFCFLSAIMLAIGRIVFLNALNQSSASYVIAVTGCYPMLMYFLALMFLNERFSKRRLVGIILVVAGGIAVQLTQAQ